MRLFARNMSEHHAAVDPSGTQAMNEKKVSSGSGGEVLCCDLSPAVDPLDAPFRHGQKEPLLETRHLAISFGGLKALEDFNINVYKGELYGLIGPNGAGKTTAFNILTGVYEASSGEYLIEGQAVHHQSTAKLLKRGLARSFQNIRLFKYLSVLQNVMVPENYQMHYGLWAGTFRLPAYWREERAAAEKAHRLLRLFDMDHLADQPAHSLPYGQQRKLEIARALAADPKLLLLDEPAAGMNPSETEELMQTIRDIRDRFDLAILLIEHDMRLVVGLCEQIAVLDHGKMIARGTPAEVMHSPAVIRAYLGDELREDGREREPEEGQSGNAKKVG